MEWTKKKRSASLERARSYRRTRKTYCLPRSYSTLSNFLGEPKQKKPSRFSNDFTGCNQVILTNDKEGNDMTPITLKSNECAQAGKIISVCSLREQKKGNEKESKKFIVKTESETRQKHSHLISCVSHVTKEVIQMDAMDQDEQPVSKSVLLQLNTEKFALCSSDDLENTNISSENGLLTT